MSNAKAVGAESEPSISEKAFDLFSLSMIDKKIIQNKGILLLSYLLKKFVELVRDLGGDTVPY